MWVNTITAVAKKRKAHPLYFIFLAFDLLWNTAGKYMNT